MVTGPLSTLSRDELDQAVRLAMQWKAIGVTARQWSEVGNILNFSLPSEKTSSLPPKWFELDRFEGYRDLIFELGLLILLAGAFWLSKPVGLVILGGELIWVAVLMARKPRKE